jgi:hypothetical protein
MEILFGAGLQMPFYLFFFIFIPLLAFLPSLFFFFASELY